MNEVLNTDITSEEIRFATFQMHPTKALGKDGFYVIFYQKLWDIVGGDVVCW